MVSLPLFGAQLKLKYVRRSLYNIEQQSPNERDGDTQEINTYTERMTTWGRRQIVLLFMKLRELN
jgi:hypothetical protein